MIFSNNTIQRYKNFSNFRAFLFLVFISTTGIVLTVIFSCTVFCDYCYIPLSTRIVFGSVVQYKDLISNIEKAPDDWCRLQSWRMNWKDMIAPCEGKMSWGKRKMDSLHRTSAHTSFIKLWELKDAGEFSRFWIQSVNQNGQIKTIGGDSWRVYIRQGPTSIAPTIIDHNNGLYEVIMLIAEPGNYSADIYLDYTLCDGLREPPNGWFINGTDYGTYLEPKEGILGNIEQDHINNLLKNQTQFDFSIHGNRSLTKVAIADNRCHTPQCTLLWDGHGYWKDGKWFEYRPNSRKVILKDSGVLKPPKRSGTLWIYGDSLGMRFIESINKHPLCTSFFKKCGYTYNWIYEVKDKRHPLKVRTGFNKTIIINKIRQLLQRQDINHPDSVFVLSLGVHFPISLTFAAYKDLIDSVILLLKEKEKEKERKSFQGTAIWKSTSAIEKQKVTGKPWPAKPLNYTMFRFLTTQRNQLFHSYSLSAMCKAGVKVLDVYPISAAFNEGTLDYVHYKDTVFYPAASVIEKYIADIRSRKHGNITKE